MVVQSNYLSVEIPANVFKRILEKPDDEIFDLQEDTLQAMSELMREGKSVCWQVIFAT